MAAEQGDAYAQSNLGLMFRKGQGVPQDYSEAARWFRMAAEQGDADARNNLGLCYEKGQGVPLDYGEAAKWLRRAAEQQHATAQYNLASLYFFGQGVPQDYVLAYMWLNLASSNIFQSELREDARMKMDLVASKMTPAQIAKAQKLAREWKPRKEKKKR